MIMVTTIGIALKSQKKIKTKPSLPMITINSMANNSPYILKQTKNYAHKVKVSHH